MGCFFSPPACSNARLKLHKSLCSAGSHLVEYHRMEIWDHNTCGSPVVVWPEVVDGVTGRSIGGRVRIHCEGEHTHVHTPYMHTFDILSFHAHLRRVCSHRVIREDMAAACAASVALVWPGTRGRGSAHLAASSNRISLVPNERVVWGRDHV